MAKQTINVGTLPNDGEGDPLRVAYQKVNSNFTELYDNTAMISTVSTSTATPNQIIWQQPATFSSCEVSLKVEDDDSTANQFVKMLVSLSNDKTSAQWMSYGNLSIGNTLASYDVAVSSGNVVIVTSPTSALDLTHKIAVTKVQ